MAEVVAVVLVVQLVAGNAGAGAGAVGMEPADVACDHSSGSMKDDGRHQTDDSRSQNDESHPAAAFRLKCDGWERQRG